MSNVELLTRILATIDLFVIAVFLFFVASWLVYKFLSHKTVDLSGWGSQLVSWGLVLVFSGAMRLIGWVVWP